MPSAVSRHNYACLHIAENADFRNVLDIYRVYMYGGCVFFLLVVVYEDGYE